MSDKKNTVKNKKAKNAEDSSLDDILQEVENLKQEEKQEEQQSEKNNSEKCEEKISELEEEKKSLEEKFLRANADMQNIRRRSDSDRIKFRQEGAKDVLKPILTAVDNFSRAFDNIPEDLQENDFVKGIVSVEKNFLESLTELGVEFFGEKGDIFNTEKHESMMMSPDAESGKIAQVFEKGVKFRETILRHAKVSVGQ